MHTPPNINTDPNRKRCTSHLRRKWHYFTTISQRKKDILLAWQELIQWRTVTTQPVKAHCTSNSQIPVMYFSFITAYPNFPFSSMSFPSFVLKGLHVVHHTCMSQITIFSCSCINLFCWSNNWLFYCFRLTLPMQILFICYVDTEELDSSSID